MPQERAFLDEITANPEYRMARLVYADWLEEKGDVRAELIRIEEEMWSTPIWSDRYWQLKPRRNELRATCDKKWLDWMNYGNHVEPVFREVPNGWRERWRLLREFVERWHGVPMPDVGGHTDKIASLERRLKLTFPPSVREWIAFTEDRPGNSGAVLDGWLGVVAMQRDLNQENPFVPELSSEGATLQHLMSTLANVSTRVSVSVPNVALLERQFADALLHPSRLGSIRIYERQDLIATISGPALTDSELHVAVADSMPRDQLPAFLWDYAQNFGQFFGGFVRPPENG